MGAPDLTEFHALAKRTTKRPCQIGAVMGELAQADRVNLQGACDRPKEEIPATAIRSYLAARGQEANVQQIAAHRRRECLCYG